MNVDAKDNDVLAAETVRTAQTELMPGQDLDTWKEHLSGQVQDVKFCGAIGANRRIPKKQ